MCYAIPGKIINILEDTAVIDYDGVQKKANVSLIKTPKIGDYVLVHAGFAIERLEKQSAEESLRIIQKMIKGLDEHEQ